jgi:hypothetical protein
MDFLRSAYGTQFHFIDPDTLEATTIAANWYRAPSSAQALGVRHQYASANWTKGIPYPELVGEDLGAPRPWQNGRAPVGFTGTGHCGDQWTGPIVHLDTPLPLNQFDVPGCCPSAEICMPRFGLGARHVTLPTGATFLITPVSGTTVFQTPDPVYPFVWQIEWTDEPCGATTFAEVLSMQVGGAPYRVAQPHCFAYDPGSFTGSWYIPGASAWYGGGVVTVTQTGAL